MKYFKKKFYQYLSTVVTFVAVFSVLEYSPFCLLIIHQPDVPEKLKIKLHRQKGSESINESIDL